MSFDARSPVRRIVAVTAVAAFALVGLVVASPGSPGSAGTADESTLASLVNGARAAAGLPPLAVSEALSATARSHSAAMAASGSLFHSGDLSGAVGSAVSGWTSVAQNVAVAGSVTEAHRALMGSAQHRGNVLGDFALLGVGVVRGGDGRLWVTEHFAKAAATAPAPVVVEEPVVEPAVEVVPAPAPAPIEVVSAAAMAPAPAPAPAPKPRARAASRPSPRRTAAVAPRSAAVVADDASCLPPPAQAHGRGHAYGRCDGAGSDGQGQPRG